MMPLSFPPEFAFIVDVEYNERPLLIKRCDAEMKMSAHFH